MKRNEIIEKLKAAGIKFTATMTNVDLELLLKNTGNAPSVTPKIDPPEPSAPPEDDKVAGKGEHKVTMLTAVWYNKVLHKKGESVILDKEGYELFKKEKFIA